MCRTCVFYCSQEICDCFLGQNNQNVESKRRSFIHYKKSHQKVEKLYLFFLFSRVHSVAFNSNGTSLVSASTDKTLKVFDVQTGKERMTLSGHTEDVYCCKYSHDSRYIISGSADKTIRVWDETGDEIGVLSGHEDWVTAIAFSPYSRRIVSGSRDCTLKVWDSEKGVELASLKGHTKGILACEFTPDNRYIVSASEDNTLKLWDAYLHTELRTMRGHTNEIVAFAFIENKYIVSGSSDQTVRVWSISSGEQIWLFYTQGQVMSLDTIGNNTIALGDGIGKMYLLKYSGLDDAAMDVSHLDLRVGKILKVQKHPTADNLYVEEVDLGEAKPRQIVSSLVKHVPINEMQGRLVVALCNIKHAKRQGIMSFGLLLGASNGTKVEPLNPPENAKPGDRVYCKDYYGKPGEALVDIVQYDKIIEGFKTDEKGIAKYKGSTLITSSGVCSVKSLGNTHFS